MDFPDYTVDEMIAIFEMRCDKSGYRLAQGSEEQLRTLLALGALEPKAFGNARGVRNLFERAVAAQADRLAAMTDLTKEDLMTLTKEDLIAAEEK